MSEISLEQLVDELVSLNDENLARRVVESSDVQWCLSELQDILAADAAPIKHGVWEKSNLNGFVRCSICHDCYIDDNWLDGKHWNFCPHCGADLRGEENGEK